MPELQETQVRSLGQEDPLGKGTATHTSILAWRIHGQRSLVGYSPWGCKELDTIEQLNNKTTKTNLSFKIIVIQGVCFGFYS